MQYRTDRATLIGCSTLAAILSVVLGCQPDANTRSPLATQGKAIELAAAGEPAVELVIDYGDGAEKRFTRIPHEDGMTVQAAMRFASNHPRGIKFESTGSGSSTLLTRIDDLANETARKGKNWLYRINGKLADKSCDAYVLAPGDVILWRFEEYEKDQ